MNAASKTSDYLRLHRTVFMLLPGLPGCVEPDLDEQPVCHNCSTACGREQSNAQIFGWIGTFILGIGFYSLSKMGKLPSFAVSVRPWLDLLRVVDLGGRPPVERGCPRMALACSVATCRTPRIGWISTLFPNRFRPSAAGESSKPETGALDDAGDRVDLWFSSVLSPECRGGPAPGLGWNWSCAPARFRSATGCA